MTKPKCFTKEKKDGGNYTTCIGFQKGDKAKPKEKPKKKMVIKLKEGDRKPKTLKKGASVVVAKPKAKPKPKEPRTIGGDLTGLNKKEMNTMSMLELMGRLPVELRKNVDSFVPKDLLQNLDSPFGRGYNKIYDALDSSIENYASRINDATISSFKKDYTDQFKVFKKSNKNKVFSTKEAIEEAYLAHMDNYYNSY